MRLRYETTLEDLYAFQDYQHTHSPTLKRIIARNRWILSIAMFVGVWLGTSSLGFPANVMFGLIGAGVYSYTYPILLRRRTRRLVKRMYAEGNNRTVLGERDLEITADGIITRSAYTESKTAWGAVERVETTPEHTLIYVGSSMAHVIPHNRLIEGDYRAFLTELGQRFKPDQRLPQANV